MGNLIHALMFAAALWTIYKLIHGIAASIERNWRMKRRLIDINVETPYNPEKSYYVMITEENQQIVDARLYNDAGYELGRIIKEFKTPAEAMIELFKRRYKELEEKHIEIEKEVAHALKEKLTVREAKENFKKTLDADEINKIIKEVQEGNYDID